MSDQADDVVVAITGPAGLRAIAAVHERLLGALQSHHHIILDLEGAAEPDITLVQLIEAARRTAAAAGKVLTLKAPAHSELLSQLVRGGFLSEPAERQFWLQEARS